MLDKSVINSVKKADPDRCRAAMFAPTDAREALLTLYAFHYELAKVPELVSEPMLGAIRYQWWRDAVDEIYTGKPVRRHEVTTPLSEVLKRYDVPRFYVDQLIDGRERDIDPRSFESLQTAQNYAAATSGTLARLSALITAPQHTDQAAKIGMAWGLTGLVRGWGYYQDTVLKEISREALIETAQQSYDTAKGEVPPDLMPAIAYAALIPGFLRRHAAKKTSAPPKSYGQLSKQTKLLGAVLRGRV